MAKPNRNKSLKQMQENALHFDERQEMLRAYMIENGLDKYWVTRDFDIDSLLKSESIFKVGACGPQRVPMPFSDNSFKRFRELPKKKIGKPFMLNNGAKLVHGTYLIGKDAGRPVIYAFSIAKNPKDKYAHTDFNIKLDMLVAGKEWLPLVRFDACDIPHPNLIVDGKVVADTEHIENTTSSHIHLNNNATQVLTTDLSYTTAVNAPTAITDKLSSANEQDFFKAALDYTLSMCGMSRDMLSSQNPEYFVDFNNYLFDYENEKQ